MRRLLPLFLVLSLTLPLPARDWGRLTGSVESSSILYFDGKLKYGPQIILRSEGAGEMLSQPSVRRY